MMPVTPLCGRWTVKVSGMTDDAPTMSPETAARMDELFEEFVAAMRADANVLIDLAGYCATRKLPSHMRTTPEEFDRRADAAARQAERVYASRRAATAARGAHSK